LKGFGRKLSVFIPGTLLAVDWKDWGKYRKYAVEIGGVPT
jgi:hypothetical protein